MKFSKSNRRRKIKLRIRKKINGTPARPRLSVFRSNKEIYAQIIDDKAGRTLVAASSRDEGIPKSVNKTVQAKEVGKVLAQKAQAENITNVVFDRNGYLYHGRVKAVAEGAREGGLKL
ncbi:MAG TPA: 50S ribosomal protein L18 [Phaeodactylibacter sp.]|nr:50S ribosomal protein L18 [Phaeodactylibacter sp.]